MDILSSDFLARLNKGINSPKKPGASFRKFPSQRGSTNPSASLAKNRWRSEKLGVFTLISTAPLSFPPAVGWFGAVVWWTISQVRLGSVRPLVGIAWFL